MQTTIRRNKPLIIFFSLVALVVVLSMISIHLYRKSQRLSPSGNTASNRALISEVGRIAVLPRDETPTIATVADPEALSNQDFFADAEVGYKVLIYPLAKKAFLYDPQAKKIVNIGPIAIDSNGAGAALGR